jgi:hypothetical protein
LAHSCELGGGGRSEIGIVFRLIIRGVRRILGGFGSGIVGVVVGGGVVLLRVIVGVSIIIIIIILRVEGIEVISMTVGEG